MIGISIYIIGFEEKSNDINKKVADILSASGYDNNEAATTILQAKTSKPHIMICANNLSEGSVISADLESSLEVSVACIKASFF